jgi:hypothetical protein
MSAELIYATTSEKAVAFWKTATALKDQERELRRAFEQRMTDAYGPVDGKERRDLWVRGEYCVGVDSGYSERPPADSGWRLDSKEHIWMPALATAAGKAWRKELGELTIYDMRSHLDELGIPALCFAGSYLFRPGIEFDDETGTLYNFWGSGMCEKEVLAHHAKVPEVQWREVKRSEWYAMQEAKEAEVQS